MEVEDNIENNENEVSPNNQSESINEPEKDKDNKDLDGSKTEEVNSKRLYMLDIYFLLNQLFT